MNLFIGFYVNDKQETLRKKVSFLKNNGLDVNVYALDVHLLMYPERLFSYDYVVDQAENFRNLYDRLEDSLFRKTLIAFINQRISMHLGELDAVCLENQYFDDSIIHLNQDEEFVYLFRG